MTKTTGIDWNAILQNVGHNLNDWINTLAHSLGVAANFLMEMEIKQMYIYGFRYVLLAIFMIAMIIVMYKLTKVCYKNHKYCVNNYSYYADGWMFPTVLLVLGMFGLAFGEVWVLTEAVGHFVNPAHYALYDIINQINQLRNGGNN